VLRLPDLTMLIQLTRSTHASVRGLADAGWGLEQSSDRFLVSGIKLTSKELELAREFGKKALERALSDIARHENSGFPEAREDVADLFKKEGPVQEVQKKMMDTIESSIKGFELEDKMRRLLREHLRATAATTALAPDSWSIGYRVYQDGVMAGLRNETGRTLHHCVILARANVDDAKWKEAKERKDKQDKDGYTLSRLFGGSESWQKSTKDLQDAQWDWVKQEKGSIVYVPEWKAGSRVETAACPLTTVGLAGMVEFGLWCDEGFSDFKPLSVERIAEAFQKWREENSRRPAPNPGNQRGGVSRPPTGR